MATRKSTTRDIPPLSLRASFVPESLNEERRTVDLVWTTGARVLRGSFRGSFWEELSLDPSHVRLGRLNSGAPLLNSHNGYDLDGQLGVVEPQSARIENGRGIATVRFPRAEDDERADKIFRKIRDGIIRNVSVGYRTHKMEKVQVSEGETPILRATDWEPHELSMVPVGADAGAGVRAESANTNPCEFVEDDEPEERSMAISSNPQSGAVPAPANEPPAGVDIDIARVRREAAEAERKRSADLRRVARALSLPDEFAERHVNEGTDLAVFRAAAIDERERTGHIETGPGLRVEGIEDQRDKWLRGAEHWLLMRAAVGGIVMDAAKRSGQAESLDPGEFRGLGFAELARQCLERAGVRTSGMFKTELIGQALIMRGSGYAATGDFPVLLENTMRKTLLAQYAITPDTWSLFCAVGSVSDFRPHPRYRLGSFGRLQPLTEHGEIQNQPIPDGKKEQIAAATKGNIIGITRQALVNDDMGTFTRLATMIGRAAKLSIEMDVYDTLQLNGGMGPLLVDGQPLFHASHANINPTGSPLSVAGLDADRVVMAAQRDPSGNEILDLRPEVLLVPLALGGLAREINDAQFNTDSVAANAPNKFMVPNRVRGMFRNIVDTPRLSGTRRYQFASPGTAPAIEVVFLEGNQTPFLEIKDGWRMEGVEWKVRLDYGVGAIDFRGAMTNAGVA